MVLVGGYRPIKISAYETGYVQGREEFLLPGDAYPTLENAFIWRERIKRKPGTILLGRLQRFFNPLPQEINAAFTGSTFTIADILAHPNINVRATEPNAELIPKTIQIVTVAATYTFYDLNGDGTLYINNPGPVLAGSVNYVTGAIVLNFPAPVVAVSIRVSVLVYAPGLPVMGLRSRELNNINNEQMVAFDQKYAYVFNAGFNEWIPGTTWNGNDSDFFWSTNYWTLNTPPNKLFWVTNFNQSTGGGDPIRYTDGNTWFNFGPTAIPTTGQIDNAAPPNFLTQCLCLLPFRGRLVAFNTWEGPTLAGSTNYPQRIRWAAIGNPLLTDNAPTAPGPWNDTVRGKGGFLDIPTSENIVSVGFVRDNLVIYCERSTWQLRYNGRSISPFQIEKVNSELGAESTFSAVQFDTSLVGIGDKGVVECDSYKSERIDIKNPDIVFQFNNGNNGTKRVHGIRDFSQKLAYWTFPYAPNMGTYPDRRLVYNYENDSWAIYIDSYTTLGNYQAQSGKKWSDFPGPDEEDKWRSLQFPWISKPALFPDIVGGNQQGFVETLTGIFDGVATNDNSLTITNIANVGGFVVITSPNHNLQTSQVNQTQFGSIVNINSIPTGTPFDALNNNNYAIVVQSANTFTLFQYNPISKTFDIPVTLTGGTYVGGGRIAVRDNFRIISKKFSYGDEGQNIQFGFMDILMTTTAAGAITLNVYIDYNDNAPVNQSPENEIDDTLTPDSFFNVTIPTSQISGLSSSKNFQRVFCPVRGAFVTLEFTLSAAQLVGEEQESEVQIDAQILYMRPAGRQLPLGV